MRRGHFDQPMEVQLIDMDRDLRDDDSDRPSNMMDLTIQEKERIRNGQRLKN